MEALLIKGAILGFAMAAPVGPVGLMTIRTSINRGKLYGQVMAGAIATGDAMYGAVAAFGLTFISDPINHYRHHIQFFGGMILLALAANIYRTRVHSNKKVLKDKSKLRVFISTLLLTLSNPTNIFVFAGAFAALNMANKYSSHIDASLVTAGVFLGSGLWFSILSWFSAKHGMKLNDRSMEKLNKIAALLLVIFSTYAIISGYRGLFVL